MILACMSGGSRATNWQHALRRMALIAVAIVAVITFLIVSVHAPIELHADAIYDDALYIALGKHIEAGAWLGPYDAHTLMKGPGYPLFLALNAWLGLPIGLSHAMFHCFAIAFFFWVYARLSKMPNVALCGFIITLWAPAPYFVRITRGAIYPGETLLVLGALLYMLFAVLPKSAKIRWGILTGLLCGWFVLTREEGIWIAPGLTVIVLYAGWEAWHRRTLVWDLVVPAVAMALTFAVTQNVFSDLNRIFYGKKTGVETTSAPFKNALAALQSVETGGRVPYVPVSRQTRLAIYEVSPAFRSLKDYFDGPGGTPWQYGCSFYAQSCGDIAGGWFLWALREAVASRGFYSSPAKAAGFYRTLNEEVRQACKNGHLQCSTTPVALFPHISNSQWGHLSSSLLSGVRQISLAQQPRINPEPSSGNLSDTASALAFLGNPLRKASLQDNDIYRIAGWYHSPSNSWVTGQLVLDGNQASTIPIIRLDSPNMIKEFSDLAATHQRFDFEVSCRTPCNFKFVDQAGAFISLNLTQLTGQQYSHSLDAGILNIDSIAKHSNDNSDSDIRIRSSEAARTISLRMFTLVMPWLAGAAAATMLLVACIAIFSRRLTMLDAIATAIWALIASRLFLLSVIDISSFPGMTNEYLAPAYVLMCIAIPVSFAALYESIKDISGRRYQRAKRAESTIPPRSATE